MDMKIVLGLLVFLVLISGCSKDPCDIACKNEGYVSGRCEKVPVILNPCESIGEITLFSDMQLCDVPQTSLIGSGVACCCRIERRSW